MRAQFYGVPELNVLYTLEDAIRDGLEVGDRYVGEDGFSRTLDWDTWSEWAPLTLQV